MSITTTRRTPTMRWAALTAAVVVATACAGPGDAGPGGPDPDAPAVVALRGAPNTPARPDDGPTSPAPAATESTGASAAVAPAVPNGASDCTCEVWLADVLVAVPTPPPAPPGVDPIPIGPVVAVFGDSIAAAVGVDDVSWVELLQQRRPDLDVRQQARMGMTIWSWPTNNMVDHIAEGGDGRAALDDVDTVVYVAGFNDLHHTEGDVDGAVDGFRRLRDQFATTPVEHFLLLPMLPVGEIWGARTDEDGPPGPIMDWINEFNRRVVEEGLAVPFDPGFDRDGDPDGYGDPEIYADFYNGHEIFEGTGGVDGIHPGTFGHEVLAEQVDELLRTAARVGVLHVGDGLGATAPAVQRD